MKALELANSGDIAERVEQEAICRSRARAASINARAPLA